MNYDPRKSIRQAMMIARRRADGGAVDTDPFLSSAVPIEGVNGPTYTSQADLDERIQQAALGQGYADGGVASGRMDPRDLPGFHVRVPAGRVGRDAGGPVQQPQDEDVRIDDPIMGYHSSPHDFERFDPSKIGTGEGNQMFGHGLYFAENPQVSGQGGDYWRQFFNKMKSGPERSAAGSLFANKFDAEKAIDSLTREIKYNEDRGIPGRYFLGADVEEGHRLLAEEGKQALEILKQKKLVGPRTYEVAIHARPDDFMNWDKPLSQQNQRVRNFFKQRGIEKDITSPRGYTQNAGDVYFDAAIKSSGEPWRTFARADDVKKLSEDMLAAGIPGIKYLDAGSRDAGEGTRNYVVFHPKHLEIKRRYADGGQVPQMNVGDDPTVQRALSLSSRVTDKRTPQLQDAADLVAAGQMGPEEYHALVGQYKPVRPYADVPPMASEADLYRGLIDIKHGKIGAEKAIPEGHPVGLRLDIPAYDNHGVWAPTIHDGHGEKAKAIAHAPFAHVSDPVFSVSENKALNVARGVAKAPFAKINGFWKKTSAEDAQAMAQEYLHHPDWRQVGMDPERHSFFYDRETRQPIVSADEALQIGPLVLAKNPKYGKVTDYKYAVGGGIDDDPTVQRALDVTRQAQPAADPVAGAMQVAQTISAPGRRRFEIAPARVAPMTIDQKDRDLPEEGSVTIKRLTDAFKKAIDNHLSLPPAQQIANARQAENNVAQYVGRGKTGKINSVLTANKKLMKAQTAGEDDTPLTLPDGRTLEMTGLALMPDYREGQFKMCGNSDVCRDLCLGKESGQYRYDPTATQAQMPTTKEEFEQAKNKPRMAAFRRTQAMMRDPESFAVYLHELIDGAKMMAEKRGAHLGVRLNVLSDLSPKIMEPIIKAHPEVSFYDYTKMNYDPVAPNHHYTYSSTGLSQPDRGVENPYSNWRKLRDRLDQGHNVAMAFAHGKSDAFPEELHDEETGKKYRVVSGDEHDFRPLDMVPEGEDGVIIALKNMAASNSEYKYENAARNSHGFFVHHDPDFLKNNRGTFARDENGDRISRNKVYTVRTQPMKRGAMRPQED